MAKLVGPLFSVEARNKIANAMVFFPWKGRAVVRRWLKPTNPRDVDQKIQRQKLAGIGKNLVAIETEQTGLEDGSKMQQMVKAETPATQIWNAYMVKKTMADLSDEGNFTELSDAIMGTDVAAEWRCAATELGMATLTGDAYATAISPEVQLAMGAYAAYKMELSSYTDVYSTYPSEWTTDMIKDFQKDYQTVK